MHTIFLTLACLAYDGHSYRVRTSIKYAEQFESLSLWMGHGNSSSRTRPGRVQPAEQVAARKVAARKVLKALAALLITFSHPTNDYPATSWRLAGDSSHHARSRLTSHGNFMPLRSSGGQVSSLPIRRVRVSLEFDNNEVNEDSVTPAAQAEFDNNPAVATAAQLKSARDTLGRGLRTILKRTQSEEQIERELEVSENMEGPAGATAAQLKAARDALTRGFNTILKNKTLGTPSEPNWEKLEDLIRNMEEIADATRLESHEKSLAELKMLYQETFGHDVDAALELEPEDSAPQNAITGAGPVTVEKLEESLADLKDLYRTTFGYDLDAVSECHQDLTNLQEDEAGTRSTQTEGTGQVTMEKLGESLAEVKELFQETYGYHFNESEYDQDEYRSS